MLSIGKCIFASLDAMIEGSPVDTSPGIMRDGSFEHHGPGLPVVMFSS
jgi:hypothetical protein